MNYLIKKKLILGTANFGSLYGLRKIKSKNNYSILEYIKQKKINCIDTSGAYLNSEKINHSTFKDLDNNGFLDLIIVTENETSVFYNNGELDFSDQNIS